MKFQNPRRRIVTAVAAATVALTAAGGGHAGAVGGPEYGIVRVSEAVGVEPPTSGTSAARRPLPLQTLQQLRGATSTVPVVDDFDWADAGIGAAGAALILGVLGGAAFIVRGHAHPAPS
jgi:hypothetical protein